MHALMHAFDWLAGFVFGWFLIDALRGLSKLGDGAQRIAQALEDLVDLRTPDEDDEDDEPTEPAPTNVVVQAEDPDEFVRAIIRTMQRTQGGPPPIPGDAR